MELFVPLDTNSIRILNPVIFWFIAFSSSRNYCTIRRDGNGDANWFKRMSCSLISYNDHLHYFNNRFKWPIKTFIKEINDFWKCEINVLLATGRIKVNQMNNLLQHRGTYTEYPFSMKFLDKFNLCRHANKFCIKVIWN